MSPTPAGVIVTATRPDGTTEDVTEGVQALYDLVIDSMDWGSGFLSEEDAIPVAHIAEVCGFEKSEEAHRYLENERRLARQRECPHPSWTKGETIDTVSGRLTMLTCDACGVLRYGEPEPVVIEP